MYNIKHYNVGDLVDEVVPRKCEEEGCKNAPDIAKIRLFPGEEQNDLGLMVVFKCKQHTRDE